VADRIIEAFQAFDSGLRPGAEELAAVRSLRGEVAGHLAGDAAVLGLVDGGSYLNGTAVHGWSVPDLFVLLDAATRPKPAVRLAALVQAVLPADLLVSARPDGSLLLERIGTPGLRLIPALEAAGGSASTSDDAGAPAIRVPDAAGRWVPHRPAARSLLLDRLDDDGSVRLGLRLLLAWKHRQAVPVSSYYLETVAVRQALQQRSFSVLWDVCWIWERLRLEGLVRVPDPTAPDGKQAVRAAGSLAGAVEAQFPLERAATSARGAVNAYIDGDTDTATAYLRAVFGDGFPAL
jgi:hypothetical protein